MTHPNAPEWRTSWLKGCNVEITIGLALIAGLVSFISPCVLPLVPAYIGYMGGRLTHQVANGLRDGESNEANALLHRLNTFLHGIAFVVGFSLVFVLIGLVSTAFVQQIGGSNIRVLTDLIGRLGGLLIIVFGLHFMGIVPALLQRLRANQRLLIHSITPFVLGLVLTVILAWGLTGHLDVWNSPLWDSAPLIPLVSLISVVLVWLWLALSGAFLTPKAFLLSLIEKVESVFYGDTRRQMTTSRRGGYLDSFLMGVVFSAGWTPCIGPIYGTVLTLAANGGDVGRAGVLLAMYSLGLGVPFLLTALLLDSAQTVLRRLQRHMRAIELTSGAFLVVVGVLVASSQLQNLSQQFAGQFAEFSIEVEEQAIQLFTGGSADPLVAAPADDAIQPTLELGEVGLDIGSIAPDFVTVTDTGESVTLSNLRGSIVLLNFWATWCGPCRIEMPELQSAYEQHVDQGFVVLAINNGETLEDVAGFRDELALTFPLALDERALVQRQYAVMSYPSTFLLDRDGRILARHFGPLTDAQTRDLLARAGLS